MSIERDTKLLSQLGREPLNNNVDLIVFSREFGAPFNLTVSLDPYYLPPNSEQRLSLFNDLLDPQKLEPYYRWQLTRRVINPFWLKGSGFEGHLLGLPEQEILEILSEVDKDIRTSGKIWGFLGVLKKLVDNPNTPISLTDALNLKTEFEVLLARMRAMRSKLQKEHPKNKEFQETVYSFVWFLRPCFSLEEKILFVGFNNELVKLVNNEGKPIFGTDIRNKFPYLAEIGRFGFPPFRILLNNLKI